MAEYWSKPHDMPWSEYLTGYGLQSWRRPGDERRFHEIMGSLQPLYGLLCGNLLKSSGPKRVFAEATPYPVVKQGHSKFTFRVQCLVTGRKSQAIPYERLIEFGVLTEDTETGGPFPIGEVEIEDRISAKLRALEDRLVSVRPVWTEPGLSWGERYQEYLKSEQWAEIREQVLRRDSYRCQWTGKASRPGDPLQVHHLTYERVGREEMQDLVTVCRSAHRAHHAEKRAA